MKSWHRWALLAALVAAIVTIGIVSQKSQWVGSGTPTHAEESLAIAALPTTSPENGFRMDRQDAALKQSVETEVSKNHTYKLVSACAGAGNVKISLAAPDSQQSVLQVPCLSKPESRELIVVARADGVWRATAEPTDANTRGSVAWWFYPIQ